MFFNLLKSIFPIIFFAGLWMGFVYFVRYMLRRLKGHK